MFGQERSSLLLEYEILKENHETLERDYQSLQKRIKLEEDTYEVMKKHHQNQSKELEVRISRLSEDFDRERSEKDKFKKMTEEMKSELMVQKQETLLVKREEEEKFVKIESKYVELADKFGVIESECAYLKSIYDAEVAAAAPGTPSAVMSGIGDTENNEVNHNVDNDVTEEMEISDESDADKPPKESSKSSQLPVERNQAATGDNIFTPSSVNHPPPTSASPSSSSSSSSSSYAFDDVFRNPPNWPAWATPKVPGDKSSKP